MSIRTETFSRHFSQHSSASANRPVRHCHCYSPSSPPRTTFVSLWTLNREDSHMIRLNRLFVVGRCKWKDVCVCVCDERDCRRLFSTLESKCQGRDNERFFFDRSKVFRKIHSFSSLLLLLLFWHRENQSRFDSIRLSSYRYRWQSEYSLAWRASADWGERERDRDIFLWLCSSLPDETNLLLLASDHRQCLFILFTYFIEKWHSIWSLALESVNLSD